MISCKLRKKVKSDSIIYEIYDVSKEKERKNLLRDFSSKIGEIPLDVLDYIAMAEGNTMLLELSNRGKKWQLFDVNQSYVIWRG